MGPDQHLPNRTTVAIIGAGQAGLAMSRHLSQRSIDHVLIERGDVANSWRTERWDSLRLLTPNWMTRLPDHRYDGDDPDGYMTAGEVVDFLADYRTRIAAPVVDRTTVITVEPASDPGGWHRVVTDAGTIEARAVVVATGACSTPKIPAIGAELPAGIRQLAPIHYRNPDAIGVDGRILVVGASASGAQLADELARAGRDVTIAAGDHVRLPRDYRGMDIHWWMTTTGVLDERWDEVPDIMKARRAPSLQLVGSPERRSVDLNTLHGNGVQVVGRLAGINGSIGLFSGSLANQVATADLRLGRLLDRFDAYATEVGLDAELAAPERPAPTSIPTDTTTLDLTSVGAVIWATGFTPNYPWLPDGLLDRKGAIRHDGGVMTEPGFYVIGLPFTRKRKSTFLDGVADDAADLSAHLAGHLDSVAALAA
ncbi:MAG: NAD(P)-binding domain-containing protein [Actinomycetota bacterium]